MMITHSVGVEEFKRSIFMHRLIFMSSAIRTTDSVYCRLSTNNEIDMEITFVFPDNWHPYICIYYNGPRTTCWTVDCRHRAKWFTFFSLNNSIWNDDLCLVVCTSELYRFSNIFGAQSMKQWAIHSIRINSGEFSFSLPLNTCIERIVSFARLHFCIKVQFVCSPMNVILSFSFDQTQGHVNDADIVHLIEFNACHVPW